MSHVTFWIASLCQPDPGYGGYAFVRVEDGARSGVAGGDRRTTGLKMTLTAVIRALETLSAPPGGTFVTLQITDEAVALDLRRVIAGDPDFKPVLEGDLWAELTALIQPRAAQIGVVPLPVSEPAAGFAQAWADFGADAAKTRGAFKSPIPKPNLLKFPG